MGDGSLILQIGADDGQFLRVEIVGRRHPKASAMAAKAWLSVRVRARAGDAGEFRADFSANVQDLDFAEFAEELGLLLDSVRDKRKIGAMPAAGVASFYTVAAQVQITVVRQNAEGFVAECVLQDVGAGVRLEFALALTDDAVRGLLAQTATIAQAYPSPLRESETIDVHVNSG